MLISKKNRDTLKVQNTIQIEGTEIPTTIKTVVTACQQKENGWATYVAHATTRGIYDLEGICT